MGKMGWREKWKEEKQRMGKSEVVIMEMMK